MGFKPSENLSEEQVKSGLKLVVADGLAAESMVALTGGTFLVAMALHMGASNFQLGLLAALPTFSSIFQLVAVWLVQRYNNRKAITTIFNFLARFPLFIIGAMPLLFSGGSSVYALIFFLFFHYYFGAVAGATWNSWMRDLVPVEQLGSYFSHRGRLTQILNVILSLGIAFMLDYIKVHYPDYELIAYSWMFIAGGAFGVLGVFLLGRTPEPMSKMTEAKFFQLLQSPLKDTNFRRLLSFNSFWAFALNIATPFFSVYMMKTLLLPLSWIIGLGIINQLCGIFSIRFWGRYSDKYSNKTIIRICAPVYIVCLIGWAFTGMPGNTYGIVASLVLVNALSGVSIAGINLAITNMGMKLAPREEAIVYLSVKNMIVAFFSAIAPLIGGLLADFFSSHQLVWSFEWHGEGGVSLIPLIDLKGWCFFFVIGGLLAMYSLRLLRPIQEQGEVAKDKVVTIMRSRFRHSVMRGSKVLNSKQRNIVPEVSRN